MSNEALVAEFALRLARRELTRVEIFIALRYAAAYLKIRPEALKDIIQKQLAVYGLEREPDVTWVNSAKSI